MEFPPLCTGQPIDMGDGAFIDGVTDAQHQWVEGPTFDAPGPVGDRPVRWEELVCERCGAVSSAWRAHQEDHR